MGFSFLRLLNVILIINIIVGVFVFHHGLDITWIDSIYFVVTIVTTIGFGDFNFAKAPLPIKIYGIYLMISGASGYALLLSIFVETIIKNKLLEFTGRKTYKMSNHVILCGFGKVGSKILDTLLFLEEQVIVIEKNDSSDINILRNKNIPYLLGDMTETETLMKASLPKCKAIIFCTDDDLANLEGALTARELEPNVRVIIRIYDQKLANKIEKGFKFNLVFSTSTLAAPTFAQAAHDENIIGSTIIDGELFLTTKLKILPRSQLDGMKLADLKNHLEIAALFLDKKDNRKIRFPQGNEVLAAEDEIIFTINRNNYKRLKNLNLPKG